MSKQGRTQDQDPTPVRSRREEFQGFLDEKFPIGAMCAVIATDNLLDSANPIATGRLLCSAVEDDEFGRPWYELVIDARGDTRPDAVREPEPLRLWTRAPQQHRSNPNLWEAEVQTQKSAPSALRLNADPPEPWRPTATMRKAVDEAYAAEWAPAAATR